MSKLCERSIIPLLVLACVSTSSLTAVPSAAAPIQAALSASSAGIVTAILVGAASTQAAVDRSDATIHRLFDEARAAEQAKVKALRQTDLSEQARSRLEVELAATRGNQESLLVQLAAKDREYSANLKAYREGLTGLLASNDPRIIAALKRYASGDVAALDDLQEVTRLIRQARDAGMRARDGADQRGVAQTWTDAKDKGQRTYLQVLAAWREAAAIDPDDFWQWIKITRLELEANDIASASIAVEQAKRYATTPGEHSIALGMFGDVAVAQGRLDAARQIYDAVVTIDRRLDAANPTSASVERNLSVNLSKVGDVAREQERFDAARSAYDEALDLARQLAAANPDNVEAERAVSVCVGRVGYVALAQGRTDAARAAYFEALAIDRQLVTDNPRSFRARSDIAVALSQLGFLTQDRVYFVEAIAVLKSMKLDGTLEPDQYKMLILLQLKVEDNGEHK